MINGQMFHQSNIFAGVLTTQIFKFFPWFKFLPKIRFSIVYFYKYEHLKRFVWKDDVSQ